MRRALFFVGVSLVLLAGAPVSDARFTAVASSTGSISTRTWFFLHNVPSPPTGNSAAQDPLAMNAVVPVATTLYDYDTNFDNAPGRSIRRNGTGADDTNLRRYASWRSAAFGAATTVSGTVTLRVWTGVEGFQLNTRGALVAYLRDVNASTGVAVTIASATLDEANWQGGVTGWVEKRISIVVGSYTLTAGRQLELKLQVPSVAPRDMVVAYDTVSHLSILGLP